MSSDDRRGSKGPGQAIASFIQVTHREWYEIVEQETFKFGESDISSSAFRRASQCGAIERVEPNSTEWRLTEPARKRIRYYKELEREYPAGTKLCPHCGHHGFSNLRDGGYECTLCEKEFVEFDEVMG